MEFLRQQVSKIHYTQTDERTGVIPAEQLDLRMIGSQFSEPCRGDIHAEHAAHCAGVRISGIQANAYGAIPCAAMRECPSTPPPAWCGGHRQRSP
jgi:hypothetical protein